MGGGAVRVHLKIAFQIGWCLIVPFQDLVCVVDDNGVGVAVVGRVCIGVIAEPGQHGGNLGHVPQHIPRDVASPLGESFQVHRLDDLVCGSFNPGERGRLDGVWAAGKVAGGGGGPGTRDPLSSPQL